MHDKTAKRARKSEITRRSFLTWTFSAAIGAACPASAALPLTETAPADAINLSLPTLDAAIDVLIPADTQTPSASVLNVGQKIVAQAETDPAFKQWLIEGLKWFDQGVTGSFIQRGIDGQTQLMRTLADSPVGSQTRIFFEQLRLRTMTAYYADPRSRTGLAVDRPPQPLGYPDFAGRL